MWYCYIVVDEVKDVLAETSLSNNLIQIIQVNQGKLDPESQQLIKMASDLLILLLTGGRELDYNWMQGLKQWYFKQWYLKQWYLKYHVYCSFLIFSLVLNSAIQPFCIKLQEYEIANTRFLS